MARIKAWFHQLPQEIQKELKNIVRRVNYDKKRRLKAELESMAKFSGIKGEDVDEEEIKESFAHVLNDKAFVNIRLSDFDNAENLFESLENYYDATNAKAQITSIITHCEIWFFDNGYIPGIIENMVYVRDYGDGKYLESLVDGKFEELDLKYYYIVSRMSARLQDANLNAINMFWRLRANEVRNGVKRVAGAPTSSATKKTSEKNKKTKAQRDNERRKNQQKKTANDISRIRSNF